MADESILAEADRLIHGERHTVYGDATADFTKTANLWNAMLGDRLRETLGPQDVALMMALLKISRESHQHKRDNNVDAIGYIALGHDISEKKANDSHAQGVCPNTGFCGCGLPQRRYEEVGDVSPITGHHWVIRDGIVVCKKCDKAAANAAHWKCTA